MLPLLSVEGFVMVGWEWHSKSMGNDFSLFFLENLKKSCFFRKSHVLSSTVDCQKKRHSSICDNFLATGPIAMRFEYVPGGYPSGL